MSGPRAEELERELEEARASLEHLVARAYAQRKSVLDRTSRDRLREEVWRQRMKVAELERDYSGELLAGAAREAGEAAASQDHERYEEVHQRIARYRVRFADASDLLEKLKEDGPASSARLLGG